MHWKSTQIQEFILKNPKIASLLEIVSEQRVDIIIVTYHFQQNMMSCVKKNVSICKIIHIVKYQNRTQKGT